MNDMAKYLNIINESVDVSSGLFEGIRHGKKEADKVLSNPSRYNVGVEYELVTSESLYDSVYSDMDDIDYDSIDFFDGTTDEIESVFTNDDPNAVVAIVVQENEFTMYYHDEFIHNDTPVVKSDAHDAIFANAWAMGNEDACRVVYMAMETLGRIATSLNDTINDELDMDNIELNINPNIIDDVRIYHIALFFEKYESDSDFDDLVAYLVDYDYPILHGLADENAIIDPERILAGIDFLENLRDIDDLVTHLVYLDDERESTIDTIVSFTQYLATIPFGVYTTPDYTVVKERQRVTYMIGHIEQPETIHELLGSHGVRYDRIEHDGEFVEVITEAMPLDITLRNMETMFSFIDSHAEISTNDSTGMHISISTNQWNLDEINFGKLMILMNFDYIHTVLFQERGHVDDFNSVVRTKLENDADQVISHMKSSTSLSSLYDNIFGSVVDMENLAFDKYQSLNAQQYNISNGRLELRYFGGEDYETRYEVIEKELIRALAIMDISYGSMYEKEYQKAKYVYLDDMITRIFGIGVTPLRNLSLFIESMNFGMVDVDTVGTFLSKLPKTHRDNLIMLFNTLRIAKTNEKLVFIVNGLFINT